jgi:hypothetical protein
MSVSNIWYPSTRVKMLITLFKFYRKSAKPCSFLSLNIILRPRFRRVAIFLLIPMN